MKKIRITEETFNRIERNKYNNQSFDMLESLLDEDYPSAWDKETFKDMHSFKKRVAYCTQHLQKIGAGSSRIAYKIDNTKVLKLAKNKKGIAQNDVEIEYSQENFLEDVLAKVFDYDTHELWLEMEIARKVTKSNFRAAKGFSFEDFSTALYNQIIDDDRQKYRDYPSRGEVDEETLELIHEDELFIGLRDYVQAFRIPFGDLLRLSSYGIVKRSYGGDIVLIDYGLTEDVYDSYYS